MQIRQISKEIMQEYHKTMNNVLIYIYQFWILSNIQNFWSISDFQLLVDNNVHLENVTGYPGLTLINHKFLQHLINVNKKIFMHE